MTLLCMGMIMALLLAAALWRIEYDIQRKDCFSVNDMSVLKGLWSIIVILVHIPEAYRNPLQDLMGSFAYIGVTFFFFTSGYGLKIGMARKPGFLQQFWSGRLTKLLIPALLINAISFLINTFLTEEPLDLLRLIRLDGWVVLLILCYAAFWLSHSLMRTKKIGAVYWADILICFIVITYSLLCEFDIFEVGAGWSVEVLGFLYGLGFSYISDWFAKSVNRKWMVVTALMVLASAICGGTYLKLKVVFFWGSYILRIALGMVLTCLELCLLLRFRLDNPWNRFLGNVSYETYLLHRTTFVFLIAVIPAAQSGVFIVSTVAVTLFGAWCVNLLKKKWLHI